MEYTFTVANFEEEVLNSPLPVLVDFYADWCNPCKMMAPTVAKLAEAYEGKVKVGKINVDENMTIAQKYRVAKCMEISPSEYYPRKWDDFLGF
jgi:thioredoxin 1